MSLNRYAKRRDLSEPGIIQALESVGALVYQTDRPCDLIVAFRALIYLMECKTIHAGEKRVYHRKRQKKQIEFLAATKTPVVTNPDEALRVIGAVN